MSSSTIAPGIDWKLPVVCGAAWRWLRGMHVKRHAENNNNTARDRYARGPRMAAPPASKQSPSGTNRFWQMDPIRSGTDSDVIILQTPDYRHWFKNNMPDKWSATSARLTIIFPQWALIFHHAMHIHARAHKNGHTAFFCFVSLCFTGSPKKMNREASNRWAFEKKIKNKIRKRLMNLTLSCALWRKFTDTFSKNTKECLLEK